MDTVSGRGSSGALSSSADSITGGHSMHHSLSTPAGVDGGARTPPATPKKGGKMLAIRVQMLDDTVTIFQVQAKALGRVLFEQVCNQLHLLEVDYFGLEYSDANRTKYWLDLEKPISRQLGLSLVDPLLYFCVKFYTPDPAQLEEEYTRYFFCLQVKRDLAQGIMQCNENTAALMASYIVQAECGDYVPEDYPDHTYLSSYKFVPQQDREMEKKIMENHKRHAGQSPEVADLNLLETARRCELYGVKMHPAKDHENVALNLAVAHMGILVFQNYTKINTFSWAKIRKISFKRKKFLIKLHPEGYGCYKDTVEFFFEGRNECKNFWKKCVENHGFFRCSSVKHVSRHKTRVLSRGSSFRYSGKTQKEIVEFVRENYVKRQTFQRSHSFRHSSAHSSASNMHTSTVGNSISAHPLLPLADSSLSAEASKLSASLGSMGAAAGRGTAHARPASPTTKSASHPRDTATSWSSVPDTIATNTKPSVMVPRPPAVVPTTSSPSPTETRSASDASSATASPSAGSPDRNRATPTSAATANRRPASPLAVRAAVHRADTADITTTTTTRTRITSRTPSSHKSEGSLDRHHQRHEVDAPAAAASATHHCALSQTQSQNDLMGGGTSSRPPSPSGRESVAAVAPKRKLWRRSASCRDLYDFSFEETGRAKRRAKSPRPLEKAAISLDERRKQQDSPVTVYDDRRAFYGAGSRDSSLEIQQDIMVVVSGTRSFASTGAGTASYSQESVEDPGNYELRDSQEDLSHDSYELIEKSDDSASGGDGGGGGKSEGKRPFFNATARSCSLDSGNYPPSDSESEERRRRKQYKSVSDHDLCLMEDPRDFPREIVPRKSDGSFYRHFRHGSRTPSVESKSDYYETGESPRRRGVGSRTSSLESRDGGKPSRRNKSADNLDYYESRASSLESKSEYFDAKRGGGGGDFDRKINFERNYGTQRHRPEAAAAAATALPHYPGGVYAVETEQSVRVGKILSDIEQNTLPIAEMIACGRKPPTGPPSPAPPKTTPPPTHIWPENIVGLPTSISGTGRSTESESNIFSFDEDRIQSLQEGSDFSSDHGFGVVPNIEAKTKRRGEVRSYRDVFMEIEPRRCHDLPPLHQPIERTKSDPNSLARQRLNSSARRLLLMHQKSIDLTPAESSDEDYLYKQIPSAPPITKFKGTHFEMPVAEFGHFDILKREMEGQKTKFEVPKSQFEVLGAKDQADLINLPPKGDDIPYVLHKRHVMNGTAQKTDDAPDATKSETPFLFTQNIDLSKVNPVTLEVEKTAPAVQLLSSPKRDITHIDPLVLETLNSKLSQIESDSPTSSRTESLKPMQRAILKPDQVKVPKIDERPPLPPPKTDVAKPKVPEKSKSDIKPPPKRVIKPRMQPGKKSGKTNKTKVRITSFSSDDESLDSDDVFGSAEATPTKIEFSPPQMRKEMESILKFESERKYLPYTMSSTEVEGSPPTTRRKTTDNGLDPFAAAAQQTELRRISERSLSIPSSEDEFNNIKVSDLVFVEPPDLLKTVEEADREDADKSPDETLRDELTAIEDERAREKALLQAEIENDLKDLRVPSKTKITEIRGKGASPLLFAHARLNLSEGSAFSLLQKQQALDASPLPNRRARSLDAPIIPVNKLPPLNAFSSKDDTVEEEEEEEDDTRRLQKFISTTSTEVSDAENGLVPDRAPRLRPTEITKKGSLGENDQIVPDVAVGKKKSPQSAKPKPNLPPKGVVPAKPKEALGKKPQAYSKERPRLTKPRPKEDKVCAKPPLGPKSTSTESKGTKPPSHRLLTEKAASAEGESKSDDDRSKFTKAKSFSAQSSLTLPEIKRTKSQEMEQPNRRAAPKEKARSLEKLELRRLGSKERTKSQEESEEVIAERRKLQQMLYETAIKQTKTLKSPVKDILPVFPQVEETVRERGGKLEISINTIEPKVSLEEAIIVTKSPKKLDKKLDKKLTKSLELDLNEDADRNVRRMGKSLDLERSKSEDEADKSTEFDFKPETIESINARDKLVAEDASPDLCAIKETVTAVVHRSDASREDRVILEGTSLDVWLSVADKNSDSKLRDIEVIKDGGDFFEQRTSSKPPDLRSKSSSDSASLERVSLGNSLDIRYIDESADSSGKSDKDRELMAEMRRASATVSKFIRRRLEKKRKPSEDDTIVGETPVRITSEDESLTEVSDLRPEEHDLDKSLLTVTVTDHKDALLKLSIERSKSEDTGSWMTVECEEYVGAESSLDCDNAAFEPSPEKLLENNDSNLLGSAEARQIKNKFAKRGSDHSKSSDTGSWTSGEKELSPSNNNNNNVKETDESSVSCSMGRAIGLSQNIEMFATKDQLEKVSSHSSDEQPKSPRSPRICVLGRAFTIDEGSQKLDESSSDEANEIPKDLAPIDETPKESTDSDNGRPRKPYPFEEKWSHDSELGQRLHKKLSKKLSSTEKGSLSSMDESHSFSKLATLDKPNLLAVEKLSTESRNSLDTESSSGSLGIATRAQKSGDIPRELSSTWKPFPLQDSSGSESFDDGLLPPDHDLERHEYFLCRDNSGDFAATADVHYKSTDAATPTRDDTELPEDLANFPTNFGYPCITSLAGGGGGGGGFLSRTLSRISERSTNSEKSSLEEDATKASTQSDSLNDESLASSNPQVSISSESPSHAHVYDEKKTPTNEKPSSGSGNRPPTDPMPHHFSSLLQRQISDDRRTSAEMAELSMDDIEIITSERGLRLRRQGSDDTIIDEEEGGFDDAFAQRVEKQSSQESEEWPLPEIPTHAHQRTLLAMHELPSSDTSAQLTTQVYQPPPPPPKSFGLKGSQESQEQWPSPPSSAIDPIVESVESYYVSPAEEAYRVNILESSAYDENDSDDDDDGGGGGGVETAHTYENVTATEHVSESLSDSQSVGPSGVKIVLEEERTQDSNSDDDDLNISDDVFVDETAPQQLRPPTVVRRSADDSRGDRKGSHSSYSEDDCTSSLGTNLDEGGGTVRFALKPTKCTHSSHSEDTSIALSLSEWSNSTTTVKFQNLSSSGTTKSSSGLKSDENSLTDIAQSISEWSSTQSGTLKAQQQQQYQKLTNTTSDSTTLTERIPSISDWPSAQPTPTRLGSSIDIEDALPDQRSPKNIPSEDFSLFAPPKATADKSFTKSTERPMVIPVPAAVLSDTDKSSGSLNDKKAYLPPKYHSGGAVIVKSTDRPMKVNLKLAKCSPYYSSSLSSESTPLAGTSPSKTATVPPTRLHKRPVSRSLTHAKSPPSENDSTSSVESPKSKSERERRGYRRKRQLQQQRNKSNKTERESLQLQLQQQQQQHQQYPVGGGVDEFYYVENNEHGLTEYSEYIRERNMEEMASSFQFESVLSDEGGRRGRSRGDRLDEGYYPDVDSQSGSDIFRMEREDEDKAPEPVSEGFDVSSIPPPLLLEDDDFGGGPIPRI